MNTAERRRVRPRKLVLHAILAVLSIFMIYPWLVAISTSLKASGELTHNTGLIPQQIDFAKFVDVFAVANVPRLALNSVVVTGATVALVLLLASLAAYAFARLDFALKETIFVVFLLGLMLQAAAIIVPLYQVNNALHLLNTHVAMIGPYTALGLPFAILILRGFFEELPREIEDAARVDGASRLTIYWRVMLPLTRPALTTVGIFIGLGTWNDFLLPMIFTTSPDMRTLPLGLLSFVRNEWWLLQEQRFALIVIMTLPVAILFVVLQRQFIAGLTSGAVKQ